MPERDVIETVAVDDGVVALNGLGGLRLILAHDRRHRQDFGLVAVVALPEFKGVFHVILSWLLEELEGNEVALSFHPERVYEQTGAGAIKDVSEPCELVVSACAGELALAFKDTVIAAHVFEYIQSEGDLVRDDTSFEFDTVAFRVMRPDIILESHW